MKTKIRICILIVCVVVFVFSAFQLFSIYQRYQEGDQLYEEIAEDVFSIEEAPTEEITPTEHPSEDSSQDEKKKDKKSKEIKPKVSVDFAKLTSINHEIIGWIYIPDTPISYPLVKGADNEKYLHRSYNNASSYFGSIFMDYRNDGTLSEPHTIIYGHNMKNGSMFGYLKRYSTEDFFHNHKNIYIFTEKMNYTYEVVSMYITNASGSTYDISFSQESDYLQYLKNIANQSILNTGQTLTVEDKLITLSTCTSSGEDKRFVVHGKLIEKWK